MAIQPRISEETPPCPGVPSSTFRRRSKPRCWPRPSVYRTVRAYREGTLGLEYDAQGRLAPLVRTTVLLPTLRRSLLALLKAAPRVHGQCRTRWSCATLVLTLEATRGIKVSAETTPRWVHEVGWAWKRAKLVAKDDDPHRV
jgi:transposase